MLYIFLDIDGVLNKESDWRHPFTLNTVCVDNFKSLLDVLTRKNIEWKIILTSTWKAQKAEVRDRFARYGIHVNGMTETLPGSDRGKEICRCLDDIGYRQSQYIVIDDDGELLYNVSDEMKTHLYLIDYREGFAKRDKNAVLRIILRMIKIGKEQEKYG